MRPESLHFLISFLSSLAMSDQPAVDTATATEQAKMLVKTGAISAIKSGTKNSGFKRSRTLEGKLKVETSSTLMSNRYTTCVFSLGATSSRC